METTTGKTTATLTHLSAFGQYIVPLGNFVFPIIIWSSTKKDSAFVDHHGRQVINFQLSIFLYSLILFLIAAPILLVTIFKNVPFSAFIDGDFLIEDFSVAKITGIVTVAVVAAVILFFMKVAEFFLIINAAVMAANGKLFHYPLTINFIKATVTESSAVTESSSLTEMPIEPQQP
ncbi:MAG TPA: DUF4870 domain-containing protein [Flavobacterium sp.]|jgi:hypothetical protein